ncbi:MAG: glycosyltransferase 87 family protein [Firmicutes bacterium]|nr:glycosyltransferase 87 family protein [Bacillota bacterium]
MTQPWFKRFIAFVSITVWMTWAYLRLRPPHSLVRHGLLLVNRYNAWSYRNLAYSDIVKLYQTRFLYLHLVPYIHNRIEYPVITGLFMTLAALGHGIQLYFFVTFVIFWLIALMIYWLLERLIPETAVFFGLLPLLLVYGLLNWDLLGIAFMVLGYFTYQRQHYVASAIWFALGVFAKLFPVFFLPFIVADLWRRRETRTLGRMVITFLAAAVVINGPFAVGNFANWSYFFTYNAGRGLGADIYANEWIHGITIAQANVFSLVVVVLTVLFLMWRVYRGGRVVDAAALSFAVFLFVNKVYSPQYTLWLFVLAIMAEWPVWTYIVLALAGLTDYVNSFTVLHLVTSRSPATGWYVNHVFFLGILYRYLSLAVTAVGAAIALAVHPEARALDSTRAHRLYL